MGLISCVFGAHAALVSWDNGAPDTLWNSAANWNPDGVPTSNDDVTINWGGITISVKSTAGSVNSLNLKAGFLQLENDTGGQLNVNHDFTMSNGGISVRAGNSAQMNVGGNFSVTAGSITLLQELGEFAKVNIVGDLTMSSGVTLASRGALGGQTFGMMQVGGTVTLGSAKFSPTALTEYDAFETKILIIHNVSTNDTMGVFGNATFDTTTYTLGSGTNTQKYMLRKGDYDSDGHDNDIYLQEIIPEPKTISLSVIAGIPIFLWQQLSPTS